MSFGHWILFGTGFSTGVIVTLVGIWAYCVWDDEKNRRGGAR